MKLKIGYRKVGESTPCLIIAEAGVNHNGDLNLAKKLIDVAANAKADAIKFQTFKTENVMTRNLEKADYQKITTNEEENFFEMAKKLEFPFEMFIELKNYAESKNLLFLSTPFCNESAEFLHKINLSAFKISSGDVDNFPFLKKIIQFNKPIILSTGTANFQEVQDIVTFFKKHKFSDLILLQCTTAYPTPLKNVNLEVIKTYKQNFPDVVIGFSDHSQSVILGSAARALGAMVIEKHITIDKSLEGPDHKASLNPEEFTNYVKNIRDVEIALGQSNKEIQDIEVQNKITARKSIVTLMELKKGEIIEQKHIAIKRPGSGIRPKFLTVVLGKRVTKDIKKDYVLQMDDIEW